MADNDVTAFQVRVGAEFIRMLDDLRRVEDDVPGRSEMVRRLVQRAHGQLGAKTGKKR